MVDKYREKVVNDAMRRLRNAANLRNVYDANGKLMYEGVPTPGHIRNELNRIHRMARAKARKESNAKA